jgi:lipoate synthase
MDSPRQPIEVLIPDFKGVASALALSWTAGILNHNTTSCHGSKTVRK